MSPPTLICSMCGVAITSADGNACAPCRERRERFRRLEEAFAVVARCVALVEAHAVALFESDGSGAFTLSEWRKLAFHALAHIAKHSPELLPFGDDDWEVWP